MSRLKVEIPSKVRFISPLGNIHGMWKRRQYKEIKDLCINYVPDFFFQAGVQAERERVINRLKELEHIQVLKNDVWNELFYDDSKEENNEINKQF